MDATGTRIVFAAQCRLDTDDGHRLSFPLALGRTGVAVIWV